MLRIQQPGSLVTSLRYGHLETFIVKEVGGYNLDQAVILDEQDSDC